MEHWLADLPHDALQIAFFQIGGGRKFPPGWVHEKSVPYGILAQSTIGQYEITCADKTVRLQDSEAFLTPAYEPLRIIHHHSPRHGFAARWIHFSFVLYQTIDLTTLLDMPLKTGKGPGRQFGLVIEELSRPLSVKGMKSALIGQLARRRELMWSVLRMVCALSKLRPGALVHLQAGRRLAPLLTHLKLHLATPITVNQMADLTHMSPSAFFAFFQLRMGCSPMEYVKRMRLNEAATLFSSTDNLLKEVADRTGFANPFHLSREFKRRFGLSPRQFRLLQTPSNLLHGRSLVT